MVSNCCAVVFTRAACNSHASIIPADYILFRDWAFDDKFVTPPLSEDQPNSTPPCTLSVHPTSNLSLAFAITKTHGRTGLRPNVVRLGHELAVVAPPTCSTLPGHVHHGYFTSLDDRGPWMVAPILGRWAKWGVDPIARAFMPLGFLRCFHPFRRSEEVRCVFSRQKGSSIVLSSSYPSVLTNVFR